MRLLLIHIQQQNGNLIAGLLIAISTLLLIALMLMLLTLWRRRQKIKKETLKIRYQGIIDSSLFRFLFLNESGSIKPEKVGIGHLTSSSVFQKVAIKSLVALHQNYSGEYKEKLELFYAQSGLVQYSLRKLNSSRWEHIIEGIRDLSNLRYMPALGQIRVHTVHPHEMVKLEALTGIIKLVGLQEMASVSQHVYLNDWVQSNILFQVKTAHIVEPPDLGEMLQSKNASLQLMAVRLIDHFNSPKYTSTLQQICKTTENKLLRSEINATISRLQLFYKNTL